MVGYVEVSNGILDNCADERAVEWHSVNFGQIREENFGPFDRRVSKRLGSKRDMSVDTRGKEASSLSSAGITRCNPEKLALNIINGL